MQNLEINWKCKFFNDLKNEELFKILQLRSAVFVVEQNCVFLDLDDIDTKCFHFFGENEQNEVIACSRLIAPNLVYNEMSIGRVATAINFRKKGVGKQLMEKSIENIYNLFGKQPIKIGAQLYLKKFYESFGFVQQSDVYLEDGISHIRMIKF